MALRTTDEEKSRIDEGYESGQGAYAGAGIDQLEALANDPSEHKDLDAVRNSEESGTGWDTKVGERSSKDLDKPRLQKAITFAKKRGGIIGLISLFGIGGGLLAGFLGPSSMLINLTENLTLSNDSSSTAMERRFMKVFGNMTNPDNDPICANNSKSMKCRMGRISNKALYQLQKKGVVAAGYDGKRTGYPSSNPTHYNIDGKNIAAKDLPGFLAQKENRKLAAKILGTGGAFNLRTKAWAGKHISNKLYKKFGLDRKGGLADGTNKRLPANERLAELRAKMKERLPGLSAINDVSAKVSSKIDRHTNKAKKGGVAYMTAVAGCVAVKAPGYIASAVAAVQLAQIMPFAMDFILSPGSKAKASGVDTENSITSEDMDAIGTALTNKTRGEDGNMTSALDSSYLLAALGVNKSKPPVSQKFTPGFSVLTDPAIRTSIDVADATQEECNVIMSPAAMWTAFAVDSAVTVALSATLVGGLAKVAASWAANAIIAAIVANVGEELARQAIQGLAENEDIPNAQGEELGDVIGLSAMSFFSAGGMARHLPTLSESQLIAYDQIRQENETFNREMDIASLSPFDTSSRYTFMGGIVRSMQMSYLNSGGEGNPLSTLGALFNTQSLIPSTLAATNQTQNSCGYAEQFRLNTDNPESTPAINAAGLPCTGITPTQAGMSTSDAITLLESEGWVCNEDDEDCPDISESATIEELMPMQSDNEDGYNGNGYIKNDTPLYEFINSCSNADTGDYVFGAGGCIARGTSGGGNLNVDGTVTINGEEGSSTINVGDLEDVEFDAEGVNNPLSLQAMSVFLLDFQIAQSVNGEDEETFSNTSGGSQENSGKINPEGWAYPMDSPKTLTTYGGHNGDDMAAPENSKVYSMRDGIVVATETMPVDQVASYCPVGINGPQNNLIIDSNIDGKTYRIRYAHLNSFNVSVGQMVRAGDLVGLSGNTGCSTGPHLHVDIQVDGVALQIFPRDIFGSGF